MVSYKLKLLLLSLITITQSNCDKYGKDCTVTFTDLTAKQPLKSQIEKFCSTSSPKTLKIQNYKDQNLQTFDFYVQTLYLTHSELEEISPNAFGHCQKSNLCQTHLENLNLWTNKIKKIEKGVFNTISTLIKVDLSWNDLVEIKSGAFDGNAILKGLYLHGNKLEELPKKLLQPLLNLETLNLSVNNFNYLDKEMFAKNYKLKILCLNDNKIQQIESELFSNLHSLKFLNLKNNLLKNVSEETFTSLYKLENLDISGNFFKILPEKIFDSLFNLEFLNIAFNTIAKIDVFNLRNLNEFYLNDNNITFINVEKFLKQTPSLKKIFLHNNNWQCANLATLIGALHQLNVTTLPSNFTGVNCVNSQNISNTNLMIESQIVSCEELTYFAQLLWYFLFILLAIMVLLILLVVMKLCQFSKCCHHNRNTDTGIRTNNNRKNIAQERNVFVLDNVKKFNV